MKREAKKGNRRSVPDVTTANLVERADEKAVATSNISNRNIIMSSLDEIQCECPKKVTSFDEIKVEYPRKVMYYRVRKAKELPSEEKKEKKKKAKVIAKFDDCLLYTSPIPRDY